MSGQRGQCPYPGTAQNLEGGAKELRGWGGLRQTEPYPAATVSSFTLTLRARGMSEVLQQITLLGVNFTKNT